METLWADIKVYIVEHGEELDDNDLEEVDISDAIIELENCLPELPKGATWRIAV